MVFYLKEVFIMVYNAWSRKDGTNLNWVPSEPHGRHHKREIFKNKEELWGTPLSEKWALRSQDKGRVNMYLLSWWPWKYCHHATISRHQGWPCLRGPFHGLKPLCPSGLLMDMGQDKISEAMARRTLKDTFRKQGTFTTVITQGREKKGTVP